MAFALPPSALRPSRASAADLALLGEVAALADPDHPFEAVDAILCRLRDRTGADAAELFLAAPGGTDLFLVSHQGQDGGAFGQQERFRLGEGFPGIALRAGRPLVTHHLESDADFVRSRVKPLHYRHAACVPFVIGARPAGCVLLAWRDAIVQLPQAARLVALIAGPLGTILELAQARSRLETLGGDGGRPADGAHAGFRAPTAAAVAALIVPRPPSGATCPAQDGRIQVLGGRSGWPEPCLRAGCVAAARYCIPLGSQGAVWGVATVAFRDRAPVPLTRYLPAALWRTQGLPAPADTGVGLAPLPAPPATRLEIRCCGGFDVCRDGRSLRPADFGREKARELLAALVAAGGRPASGDRLAGMLWPGVETVRGRNRFHVTLSALRRAIEPPGATDWLHVRREGRGYFLDPRSPVRVDLWRFDDLLRHADAAAGRPGAEGIRQAAVEEALILGEGDVFEGQFASSWLDDVTRRHRDAVGRARECLTWLRAGGATHSHSTRETAIPTPARRGAPAAVRAQAGGAT